MSGARPRTVRAPVRGSARESMRDRCHTVYQSGTRPLSDARSRDDRRVNPPAVTQAPAPLLRGCIKAGLFLATATAIAYRIQYARNFLALGCKGEGDGPPPVALRERGFGKQEKEDSP